MKNNCVSEFCGKFESYCHVHHATSTINTAEIHEPDALCFVCKQSMGPHNPVTSLQMICCSSSEWYHKKCLKVQANEFGDDFVCPRCSDVETCRANMLENGIYIPQTNSIALYSSFIADNDQENLPPPKRKRIHKGWIYEQTFSTKEEAEKFLKDSNFSYHYRNIAESGIRINYRCNLTKFRGEQCAAGVYLLFDSTDTKIQLFRADAEHTHHSRCARNDQNAFRKQCNQTKTNVIELGKKGL